MGYREDWAALSQRIGGLLAAYALHPADASQRWPDDPTLPEILVELLDGPQAEVERFRSRWEANVPTTAAECLDRAVIQFRRAQEYHPALRAMIMALTLAATRAELDVLLTSRDSLILGAVERAFMHLRRVLVVDETAREKWLEAFESGEVACERLGGTHLLLHGVLAFKADSPTEKTDLVLGGRLAFDASVAAAVQGLVLTEWKRVNVASKLAAAKKKALSQLGRYSDSVLAGVELESTVYGVIVSRKALDVGPSEVVGRRTVRWVNIAVEPARPSDPQPKAG